MKTVIYILLLLIFSPELVGQEWRDTLMEARKSYTQHNYDKSFRLYRSAKKLAPKEIDLSDEVAQSAYKAGKYEQAEKIYGQSSSMKGSPNQRGSIHRQVGNAQMKQQKYTEAIESYKESLRNNPEDEYARYNLAEAIRKLKKQQQQQDQSNKNKKDPKDQDNPQDGKNQPEQKDGQKKNDQPEQKKSGQEGEQNQPQRQPSEQSSEQKNSSRQKKTKLSDKKTERMLDDLMKMEMETKKKFEGVKSTGTVKKSGKDW